MTIQYTSISFPCQFRQNEIELCQDENQDRVNEFQFRFREKNFANMNLNFAKKKMILLFDFLCEIEFGYGGNEFRSCKIGSLFGKVELHVGDFQFCSGGIDFRFGEIQMEKV